MPVHIRSVVIFWTTRPPCEEDFPPEGHTKKCFREILRVKLCIHTFQRRVHGFVAGRTRELRECESWKVICVRLVEDRQGGLANFVIWF